MKQLTVVAKITANKGKEKETKEALELLIPTTLKEEGCINYDLHVSEENEEIFLFYENWTNRELWEKRMSTEHLKQFMAKADDLLEGDGELST